MDLSNLHRLAPTGMMGRSQAVLTLADGLHLRAGRVHEVTGEAADVFAILSAAKQARDIVWLGLRRDIETLCPTGLQQHLDPERVILIEAVSRGELLWACDQALRAAGGFCVIADLPNALSLKESRRLQLAAEQGGGLGLLLLRGPASSSAAQTRWHCQAVCADQPAWRWQCVKGKNGEAGAWQVTCRTDQSPGQKGGARAEDTLHLAAAASA